MTCPAICRDEIKEGLSYTHGHPTPALGDELTGQATKLFFEIVNTMIDANVTIVAEAAFQQKLWGPNLTPLFGRADIRIIRCFIDTQTSRDRLIGRGDGPARRAHADAEVLAAFDAGRWTIDDFDPVNLDVPTLDVDTRDGYVPSLDEILAFATSA